MFTLLFSAISLLFGKVEKNKTTSTIYKDGTRRIHFNECLRVKSYQDEDIIYFRKTSNNIIKKSILKKTNRKPKINIKTPFQHYARYMAERYANGTYTKEYPNIEDYAVFITQTWASLKYKRPYIVKHRNNKKLYITQYNMLNKIKPSELEREMEEMEIDI